MGSVASEQGVDHEVSPEVKVEAAMEQYRQAWHYCHGDHSRIDQLQSAARNMLEVAEEELLNQLLVISGMVFKVAEGDSTFVEPRPIELPAAIVRVDTVELVWFGREKARQAPYLKFSFHQDRYEDWPQGRQQYAAWLPALKWRVVAQSQQ